MLPIHILKHVNALLARKGSLPSSD